jgi:hypothetical protein
LSFATRILECDWASKPIHVHLGGPLRHPSTLLGGPLLAASRRISLRLAPPGNRWPPLPQPAEKPQKVIEFWILEWTSASNRAVWRAAEKTALAVLPSWRPSLPLAVGCFRRLRWMVEKRISAKCLYSRKCAALVAGRGSGSALSDSNHSASSSSIHW